MTIISRDGPDKLIVRHGAWSVTSNYTQVTLLSLLNCHRDGLILLKDRDKVQLSRSWGWEAIGISTYCVKHPQGQETMGLQDACHC